MEIKIGTRFNKKVGNSLNECYVYDIVNVESTSLLTGLKSNNIVYLAKSDTYGMGNSFDVPKSTIIRGFVK